ncbi:Asp-protease-2 multi-domain protein [Pyrenophora tritici-repentis]|nr:Asp-protease-2 multi-domain protein [Pyrenophora tritici-repentis]
MFRTINAISDNVSTGGRHPRRSSDMQPPPQPSVTDFPIGRKKRKDKAPATPRSQDSSRERPKDTASDTQQTISQGPSKHEPVRRSEPGRRSTFGYPALPVTEGDSQEPTMLSTQSLRNKNVLSAKITHSEFTFITIVQNETEDEFELYLGRESPLEEFQVPVCTDDDLLELATSNTAFLRSLAIELMKFAAACAPILDANIDAITKEATTTRTEWQKDAMAKARSASVVARLNRETRENHNRLKVAAARILSPEVGDQDNSQDVQDHYISAIAVKGHLRSTKQLRYDSYTLTSSKEWKKTTTLIDTGASASFVNRRWAKAMGLPIMSTSSPIQLSLADGKVVDTLNEAVEIQVKHGSHLSPVVCFVADVGDFDLILGMTWLEDHDPGLTFSPRSMKFSSSHCTSCCLDHGLPETVYGDGKTPSLSESRQTTPVGEICIITAKAAYLMAAHNPDEAIWVEPQDWEKLADPPDDNNDCDLDSFKRNIARLAAVTQEDYDHYMNKMESPHMTEAEIRKLDGGSRHAVYLANLITQRTLPDSIPAVAQMLYQLSEEDNISERSLCAADNVTISPITTPIAATSAPAIPNETPAAINVPAPPNNELTIDALLDNIKAAYKDDKVLQAIVKAKKDGLRRLPFKLIHGEEHLRLELGDCEITDELLYVRNKVYVPAGAVRTKLLNKPTRASADELRASMQWAQAKQAEYANEGRLPAPAFKVGDQVMLDTRNLRTKRPSASLDLKNRGPFTIVRAINNTAYELDLPANMKRIHNVFHPWLLHLVDDNPLTGQTQDPEVPAEFDPEVEDDTEYTVEAIEDCRINKKLKDPAARGRKGKTTQGLLQYLVRWANYPDGPDNPSWEPYMNLADSADTVTRYHLDHPNKPPMHRKFKSLTGKQDMLVMRLHALSRV